MKKIIQTLLLLFFISSASLLIVSKAEAQSVSFQVFYDDLSPYGSWIESPEYGYVWCPRVSGFTPYSTNGYWVLTDVGWTWVSDYSWGWAPFHYGRWYYDPIYGNVWVPGYEWGPGWVTWRRSDDYYGWAPIGPGVNINVAYSSGYNVPYNNWHFVRCNDFGRRDIHNYYVDRSKNVTIINNTTVINTTKVDNTRRSTFTPGPDRMEVQKKVGRTINPVAVVDASKPTQRVTKNSVQLYRPVVEDNHEKKAAPAKVISKNDSQKPINNNAGERKQVQPANRENNERTINRKPEVKQETPVRDEQKQPVDKQRPLQNPINNNRNNESPVNQPKAREQQERKREIQQPVPQREKVQQQNVDRPIQKQPNRKQNVDQPVRQQPVQQNVETPIQKQPERQRNMDQPVREQRVAPQQNINRPQERQMPVRREPIRQAPPVQRDNPPAPHNNGQRKGG